MVRLGTYHCFSALGISHLPVWRCFAQQISYPKRSFKIVRIDDVSGRLLSLKNREIKSMNKVSLIIDTNLLVLFVVGITNRE